MRPLLSMLSLIVFGMETKLVVPEDLISFFFGFFSRSYLVVDLERCFLWLVATEVPRWPVLDDIFSYYDLIILLMFHGWYIFTAPIFMLSDAPMIKNLCVGSPQRMVLFISTFMALTYFYQH